MQKTLNLSPNFSRKKRLKSDIKFVIIHYTGMQSEIASINRLLNIKSKVSCHYLINRKGKILQMVYDHNIAWHAGKSRWKNFKDLNKNSIGIELVNKGHKFGYENFPNLQINSLINLCKFLKRKYKIKKENFLGHSDIAPLRKNDPGEKFPWEKMSKYNLGKWYKLNGNYDDFNKSFLRNEFFFNLKKIGYRYFDINKKGKLDKFIITAFQQRYFPSKVSGIIDKKTLKICQFLAKNS
tara:strand:+ start:1515 stop:2228 length:714 start_codon:yes stop_codon:yes gene_type:complete